MRVLTIDDESKKKVQDVLDFAHRPENFYRVDSTGLTFQRPPGDDPRHVAQLDSFRVVFSVTIQNKKEWRHLSVSIPVNGKFPNPLVVLTICEMFGFSGWDGHSIEVPKSWRTAINQQDNCIVIAQEMGR